MNKIKVIEFITSMGEGGAQSLVKDYALYLDKDKFDIKVVCVFPSFYSGPGQLLLENNISHSSVYPSDNRFWHIINKLFGLFIVSYWLNKEIKKERPHVIHAHLRVLKYLAKTNLKKISLFYTCHSLPMKTFISTTSLEFKAAQKLIRNNKMVLIALHADMQKELNSLFGVKNTQIVYNGTDIRRFTNVVESKEGIRKSLHISTNAFVVGHVGRFMDAKNHEFIVQIFQEIYKRKKNAKLLLVGTGPLKANIVRLISALNLMDQVILLENRSDVDRILKAMDVFLFPSIYEGLPVSLIEAQAAGLHCVSSKNVSSDAFVTPQLIAMDLNEPIEKWADAVINVDKTGQYNKDIMNFDTKITLKTLDILYSE